MQVVVREIGTEFLNIVNIDFGLQRKARVYKHTTEPSHQEYKTISPTPAFSEHKQQVDIRVTYAW